MLISTGLPGNRPKRNKVLKNENQNKGNNNQREVSQHLELKILAISDNWNDYTEIYDPVKIVI